jgi:hypothetical protein
MKRGQTFAPSISTPTRGLALEIDFFYIPSKISMVAAKTKSGKESSGKRSNENSSFHIIHSA